MRSRSPGVDGKLVVDALRPGMRAGWTPSVEDGVRIVASWAQPGDLVLTVGAGDVERAGPLVLEALRVKPEEGVALARLTTIGTGGPARAFARPSTLAELEEVLAWAVEARASGRDRRARLEPPRSRRGCRRARAEA